MGVIFMKKETITAVFADRHQADAALFRLRAAGALNHSFSLPSVGCAGNATLHLMVKPGDAALTRSILRQSGGRL